MDIDDEDADLRAAIAASLAQDQPPAEPQPSALTEAAQKGHPEVVGSFPTKFRCYAAAAAGRKDIDTTGKVLLPQSALHHLVASLDQMPSTLILRLAHGGSACYVGVAEFIDDQEATAMLTKVAGEAIRTAQLPRFSRGGPIAVTFVPRWVRASLLLEPMAPELACHVVSLPMASALRLQPQASEFARAIARAGDARAVLTELINRFVAVATGDTLQLIVDGHRYLVDVLECRGLPHVRCGVGGAAPQRAPSDGGDGLGGAGGVGTAGGGGGVVVPAVCLVDSNVEVEFAVAADAEQEAARAEAERAAQAAKAQAAQAAREAEIAAAAVAAAKEAEAAAAAAQAASLSAAEAREQRRRAAAAALQAAAETAASTAGDDGAAASPIDCVMRCPDGSRCQVRLGADAPGGLRLLFCAVEAQWHEPAGAPPLPRDFALATTFPRRRVERPASDADATTLREAGLADGKQQMFQVES